MEKQGQRQTQFAMMERSEPDGEESNAVHATTVPKFLAQSLDSGPVKQEPEEGLSQRWEAQWQYFLKSLQSPHPGQRSPPTPSPPQAGDGAEGIPPSSKTAAEFSQLSGEEQMDQTPPPDLSEGCEDPLSSVKVKEESLHEMDTAGVEVDRRHFRQFSYREAEGPREALLQLQALCRRWLRPERCSKEEILDLLVLEQFLVILPEEMQSWVKDFRPETCAQAATLAEKFLLHLREAEKLQGKVAWPTEEDTAANFPKSEQAPSKETNLQMSTEAEEGIKGETSFLGNCQGYENEEESFLFERHTDTSISGLSLARLNRKFFQVCGLGETSRTEQSQEICQENQREIQVFLQQKHLEVSPVSEGTPKAKRKKISPNEGTTLRHSFDFPGNQKKQTLCTCTYCGKISNNSSHMTIHERTHTGEKPYKCSECGKCFSSNSNLMQHTRIHTGEKQHKCSACGQCFFYQSQLVVHIRTHTGEKPYECNKCGKRFISSSSLCKHNERLHTEKKAQAGEKSHKCPYCPKTCITRFNLLIHVRTHTEGKPFECTECGKGFSKSSSLVNHKTAHTGEKPYQCSDCGQKFSANYNLVIHQRVHKVEKRYECLECSQSFRYKASLRRHRKIHSRETTTRVFAPAEQKM